MTTSAAGAGHTHKKRNVAKTTSQIALYAAVLAG
jgi:hypothetical protein